MSGTPASDSTKERRPSWPMRELALMYDPEKRGWRIGAGMWGSGEEPGYVDGGDTAYVIDVIRNPRSQCKQVSIHVGRSRITEYISPEEAITVLESFAREVEPSMTNVGAALESWRPT